MLMTSEPASVWVGDSHPIFRRGLTACLKAEGFRVAGDSAGLSPEPQLRGVDLLLFAADATSLQTAARLGRTNGVALVALLDAATDTAVEAALEAGVHSLLVRAELTPTALTATLRMVASGNASLPANLLGRLLDRAANGSRHGSTGLTLRELDVLRLLADGEDTREIAGLLCYSERTVKNVVHDVLVKMNCKNRAHAVALATRHGVI
ncbi:MAG: response regulator transcription factor [Actinomycetota bacterium]|nr:response regulator transcription factor [Actinomycetota bacterium]